MIGRTAGAAIGLLLIVGCESPPQDGAPPPPATEQTVLAPGANDLACQPVARMPVADRPSPYDSVLVNLGGQEAKLCYGRPSVRGREIFGGLVPFDTIWRTGANEPTTIHLPFAAEIAGIRVDPGSYTIYTVPGRQQWTVIVNRSIDQWGIESQYTDAIRAQDVGRAAVPAETTTTPEEMFTISAEPTGADSADLVLTWENVRTRIPIRRV
jgi:hypothetical protein